MNSNNYLGEAKFFRGLANPTRIAILLDLIDGEKTVGEIVKKSQRFQPNVSNHLKYLVDCGLVANRRDGKNITYYLDDPKIKAIFGLLGIKKT